MVIHEWTRVNEGLDLMISHGWERRIDDSICQVELSTSQQCYDIWLESFPVALVFVKSKL